MLVSKKCLFLLLLYALTANCYADNCLTVALGKTEIAKTRIIAVAKAAIVQSLSEADIEAELSAKSLLLNNKSNRLSGVYRYQSCSDSNYAYVAVAIDEVSKKVSKSLKSKLSTSFKDYPVKK